MKIVLAFDSFKGCITSLEAEEIVANAILQACPHINIELIPIADGGEGTLSTLLQHTKGDHHSLSAHNPCMEIIPTTYGISHDKQTAFIEMALINGLPLIKEEQKNPMITTTFGTGELIRNALDQGCRTIILGLGGSATNDAGTGMLQALGYRFFDKEGKELGLGGNILTKIENIDTSQKHPLLKNVHFIVACDVKNPFYGPNGAAEVFAPQKGADKAMVASLDMGMRHFAQIIEQATGKDISQLPGSGAAGGLGGALAAFVNADLLPGADLLLEVTEFEKRLEGADLVITGEGKIDRQSLMGKITGKILEAARRKHVPAVALAGQAEHVDELKAAGFKEVYTITPGSMPLSEAMKPGVALANLRRAVSRVLENL